MSAQTQASSSATGVDSINVSPMHGHRPPSRRDSFLREGRARQDAGRNVLGNKKLPRPYRSTRFAHMHRYRAVFLGASHSDRINDASASAPHLLM